MPKQLTLKNILEEAIQKEVQSQRLYADLSQRASDEAARDALRNLVREEKDHQELLERYQRSELLWIADLETQSDEI